MSQIVFSLRKSWAFLPENFFDFSSDLIQNFGDKWHRYIFLKHWIFRVSCVPSEWSYPPCGERCIVMRSRSLWNCSRRLDVIPAGSVTGDVPAHVTSSVDPWKHHIRVKWVALCQCSAVPAGKKHAGPQGGCGDARRDISLCLGRDSNDSFRPVCKIQRITREGGALEGGRENRKRINWRTRSESLLGWREQFSDYWSVMEINDSLCHEAGADLQKTHVNDVNYEITSY